MSLIGVAPYIGINMALFDYLKDNFGTNDPWKREVRNMMFGCLSGIGAVVVIYPADVLRTKIQLSGLYGHTNYKNIRDCVRLVYSKTGVRGFYVGLVPCLLKVFPMSGIIFTVNELFKSYLGYDQ